MPRVHLIVDRRVGHRARRVWRKRVLGSKKPLKANPPNEVAVVRWIGYNQAQADERYMTLARPMSYHLLANLRQILTSDLLQML